MTEKQYELAVKTLKQAIAVAEKEKERYGDYALVADAKICGYKDALFILRTAREMEGD